MFTCKVCGAEKSNIEAITLSTRDGSTTVCSVPCLLKHLRSLLTKSPRKG